MTKVEENKLGHQHIPVLLEPILEMFQQVIKSRTTQDDIRYFDGTFGRGGHLSAVLSLDPRIKAVAYDRDPQAIQFAKDRFAAEISSGRLILSQKNYSEFNAESEGKFDLMLLDLGVSSPQLDQAERGFSFYHDGPLDMRMDPTQGPSAADLIAVLDEEDLEAIFRELGEIQRPGRVVRAIVHDRKEKPFLKTRELAGLIERVEGWHRRGHHPATNYFMALRLKVNEELDSTTKAIRPLMAGLRDGGRLAVLTFHSLEDRIVKNLFKEEQEFGRVVNKKVIKPTWNESQKNSRARSAKLRVFQAGNISGDFKSE